MNDTRSFHSRLVISFVMVTNTAYHTNEVFFRSNIPSIYTSKSSYKSILAALKTLIRVVQFQTMAQVDDLWTEVFDSSLQPVQNDMLLFHEIDYFLQLESDRG